MHEYSLVQSLLDRVEAEARKHGAVSVERIEVTIGELAGVEADLLASAFEMLRAGSICRHAELAVRAVEARWQCPSCDWERSDEEPLRCPRCAIPVRLTSGDELILERIEMEAA
jgi:hydrogenase nickel incorporation protein HypA/HybF